MSAVTTAVVSTSNNKESSSNPTNTIHKTSSLVTVLENTSDVSETTSNNSTVDTLSNFSSTKEDTASTAPVHKHSYTKKTIKPTCLEGGYTLYTCNCGKSYKNNATDQLGHNYSDWKVTKAATTTSTGTKECKCSRCGHILNETIAKQTESESSTVWIYKNGGDDYIIKTDGKTTVKIPIDVSRLSIPKSDNATVSINRPQIQKIGNWIYFYETFNYSFEKIDESGKGSTETKKGKGLFRVKEDGSSLTQISESSKVANEGMPFACGYVLGFDENDMYFIRNHGYEPGGTVCRITLNDNIENFVDNATVFNVSQELPSTSYIKDGYIYMFDLIVSGTETATIKISDLKS